MPLKDTLVTGLPGRLSSRVTLPPSCSTRSIDSASSSCALAARHAASIAAPNSSILIGCSRKLMNHLQASRLLRALPHADAAVAPGVEELAARAEGHAVAGAGLAGQREQFLAGHG